MKVKLFIVTYNAPALLNHTLETLFSSDYPIDGEITVINNHSNFQMDSKFDRVKVLHNQTRPDFSKGHLSRNWNQAIINGFKDLSNPDADILIHIQDDTTFMPNWFSNLVRLQEKYTFITDGAGDNFCAYTSEAVKNIGIWDERFCNIGYQEADYFLRAILYNGDKTTINDPHHSRVWNPIDCQLVKRPITGFLPRSQESFKFHNVSLQIFSKKWPDITAAFWNDDVLHKIKSFQKPMIPSYVMYPYFEKDLYDVKSKGYDIIFD